jgi:hypothetical protein
MSSIVGALRVAQSTVGRALPFIFRRSASLVIGASCPPHMDKTALLWKRDGNRSIP